MRVGSTQPLNGRIFPRIHWASCLHMIWLTSALLEQIFSNVNAIIVPLSRRLAEKLLFTVHSLGSESQKAKITLDQTLLQVYQSWEKLKKGWIEKYHKQYSQWVTFSMSISFLQSIYLIDLECDKIHFNHLIGLPWTSRTNLLKLASWIFLPLKWVNEAIDTCLRIWNMVAHPTSMKHQATKHCFNTTGFFSCRKLDVWLSWLSACLVESGSTLPNGSNHGMHGAQSVKFCIGMSASASSSAMNHFISGVRQLAHNKCIWDSVLGCETMANLY